MPNPPRLRFCVAMRINMAINNICGGGGGWADIMVPLIPPPEGWAFPGAPEFVRQGSYQFEYNAYTGQ